MYLGKVTRQAGKPWDGEIGWAADSVQQTMYDLARAADVGEQIHGWSSITTSDPNCFDSFLREFELRRVSERVSTLAIQQGVRSCGSWFHRYGSRSFNDNAIFAYSASALLLDSEVVSLTSKSKPVGSWANADVHEARSWEDLSEVDELVFTAIRNDIYYRKMKLRGSEPVTTGAFGSGEIIPRLHLGGCIPVASDRRIALD